MPEVIVLAVLRGSEPEGLSSVSLCFSSSFLSFLSLFFLLFFLIFLFFLVSFLSAFMPHQLSGSSVDDSFEIGLLSTPSAGLRRSCMYVAALRTGYTPDWQTAGFKGAGERAPRRFGPHGASCRYLPPSDAGILHAPRATGILGVLGFRGGAPQPRSPQYCNVERVFSGFGASKHRLVPEPCR